MAVNLGTITPVAPRGFEPSASVAIGTFDKLQARSRNIRNEEREDAEYEDEQEKKKKAEPMQAVYDFAKTSSFYMNDEELNVAWNKLQSEREKAGKEALPIQGFKKSKDGYIRAFKQDDYGNITEAFFDTKQDSMENFYISSSGSAPDKKFRSKIGKLIDDVKNADDKNIVTDGMTEKDLLGVMLQRTIKNDVTGGSSAAEKHIEAVKSLIREGKDGEAELLFKTSSAFKNLGQEAVAGLQRQRSALLQERDQAMRMRKDLLKRVNDGEFKRGQSRDNARAEASAMDEKIKSLGVDLATAKRLLSTAGKVNSFSKFKELINFKSSSSDGEAPSPRGAGGQQPQGEATPRFMQQSVRPMRKEGRSGAIGEEQPQPQGQAQPRARTEGGQSASPEVDTLGLEIYGEMYANAKKGTAPADKDLLEKLRRLVLAKSGQERRATDDFWKD